MGEQTTRIPPPAMGGKHQLDNLAAALAALQMLNPDCFRIADELSTAIRLCKVLADYSLLLPHLKSSWTWATMNSRQRRLLFFLARKQHMNTICVLAMLADKPAKQSHYALAKVCQRWLCVDSPGNRGQTGEFLAQKVRAVLPSADVSFYGPLGNAMSEALESAGNNGTILVFGSLRP